MFAVIEFGSAVRANSDAHSDKDLLIVAGYQLHSILREYYEQLGYSVSTFTFEQLQFMQKRGSLFIQHLKLESQSLIDFQGNFQGWLKTCALKRPLPNEISKSIDTLNFISKWPADSRLSNWKADFLYCVTRDFLVKSLAAHGILAFGISDISREFKALYKCINFDLEVLESLRRIKSDYRKGCADNVDSERITLSCLNELSSLFLINKAEPSLVSSEIFVTSLRERRFTSHYEKLRTLEAAYSLLKLHGLTHKRHEQLMQCIVSPNMYGSSQLRKAKSLHKFFADITDLLTNKVLKSEQISMS